MKKCESLQVLYACHSLTAILRMLFLVTVWWPGALVPNNNIAHEQHIYFLDSLCEAANAILR